MKLMNKVTVLATALCSFFVVSQEINGQEVELLDEVVVTAMPEAIEAMEATAEVVDDSNLKFGVVSLAAIMEEYHVRLLYQKEILNMQLKQLKDSEPFEKRGAEILKRGEIAEQDVVDIRPGMSQPEQKRRRDAFEKVQEEWKAFLQQYQSFLSEKQKEFAELSRKREQESIESLRKSLITFATNEGYDYILDNSTSPVLLIFPARHNITEKVIEFLNEGKEEQVKTHKEEIKALLKDILEISKNLRQIGLPIVGESDIEVDE